jgi:hypothetical protein
MPVGKGLVVSEIFEKIEKPVYGEQSRKAAKMDAFNNPPLYKKLIDNFNNKTLPNEDGLENLLKSKEYQVHSSTAARAARVFYENGRSIGIIDSSNRLTFLKPNTNGQDKKLDSGNSGSEVGDDNEGSLVKILVPFGKSGDSERGYVLIPKNYTNKHLNKMIKFLDALKDEDFEA